MPLESGYDQHDDHSDNLNHLAQKTIRVIQVGAMIQMGHSYLGVNRCHYSNHRYKARS